MGVKKELFMSEERFTYLCNKYRGEVSETIIRGYKPHDEYVLLNEDKHLHPLWIKLPEPPELHLIDGWGLPAKEQKFTRAEVPDTLQKLQNTDDITIDEIWNEIDNHQHRYKSEIDWMRTQIERVLFGYWCFINGKPTFIDGWHYGYLNFWQFQGGFHPEYRDRNRKFYHGLRYAYTTTLTIQHDYAEGDIEKKNPRIVYEDVELRRPKMENVGRRVFCGVIYPKHRRDGASNECMCAMYFETIYNIGKNSAIISSSGKHALETLFEEITIPGWQQMPFFFKPVTKSNENPSQSIEFYATRKSAAGAKISNQLGSRIIVSHTAESTYLDGKKVFFLLADEGGKLKDIDVYERHQQLKETVAQGAGMVINGFIMMPSTVGEMEGSGGEMYKELCLDSQWNVRMTNGQTQTGLMLIYMPSHEGLEGYVDEFGASIADEPTERQRITNNINTGAKKYLEDAKQHFLDQKKYEKYNELCRLFPASFMECFRTVDGDVGFNTRLVNERLEEFLYEPPPVRRGNFVWEGGVRDSFVHWEDDPKGSFELSKIMDKQLTNRYFTRIVDGQHHKFPVESLFKASADPFASNKVKGSRKSDGGGAVFYDYDESIDMNKPVEHWRSYQFVCCYKDRKLTTGEYCEDMLMMCIYFGAMMNPERDVDIIDPYFTDRGYGGYMWYSIDPATNKKSTTPGFYSRAGSKQKIFNLNRDYIQLHAKRCNHKDILIQWRDIGGMEQMTDYDLIPVVGGCLMAAKGIGITNEFKKKKDEKEQSGKIEDYYPSMPLR